MLEQHTPTKVAVSMVLTTQNWTSHNAGMNTYKCHRFPPEIISYTMWLYFRFNLSHRDIEDLMTERGTTVSYESIRLWCIRFGTTFARRLERKQQGYGDTLCLDEVFVKIRGKTGSNRTLKVRFDPYYLFERRLKTDSFRNFLNEIKIDNQELIRALELYNG